MLVFHSKFGTEEEKAIATLATKWKRFIQNVCNSKLLWNITRTIYATSLGLTETFS